MVTVWSGRANSVAAAGAGIAFVVSTVAGIVLCAGPLVLYPAFANLGIAGASFPNVDYNIVGSIIYGIGSIFA